VGKTVARSLIIRALRYAYLHHVLREQPCAVGFVIADDDRELFVEARRTTLRTLAQDRFGVEYDRFDTDYEIVGFDGCKARRSRTTEGLVRGMLASRTRLFAFASSPGKFLPVSILPPMRSWHPMRSIGIP
jgi:hypothetical protein